MNKEKWIQCANEKGFESFEIYQSQQKGRSVTWFDGQMETLTTNNILGTSIRGVYQGNMAYLALEKVEDEKMGEVLDSLKEQAQTIKSTILRKFANPKNMKWLKIPTIG